MKNSKTIIPLKQREEMEKDPFYSTCAMYGQFDHQCDGRITWEHAIRVAGKNCQAKWSIVPLCAKAHAVDQFQDNHEMIKERNEWIALSRASNQDILDLFGEKEISKLGKSIFLFRQRDYLLKKYGKFVYKIPPPKSTGTFTISQDFVKDVLALKIIASSMRMNIKSIDTERGTGQLTFMDIEFNQK
jgi:hypothetical protein